MGPLLLGLLLGEYTVLASSIYLHRGCAHGCVVFSTPARFVLRGSLWLLLGLFEDEWVELHRSHHAHADEIDDPHSPAHRGVVRVLLLGPLVYRRALNQRWISPAQRSRGFITRLLPRLAVLGILVGLLGLWRGGLTYAVTVGVYVVLTGTVNVVGHRSRSGRWAPSQHPLVALITWGETLHASHHQRPGQCSFTAGPGEVDLGYAILRALVALRLADCRLST